ncbi:Ring finger domain/Zinc finger, C3HC4 type (RING finger) containing protein [Novymonas esmeraldas]|uniref:Ring finger domain/Zinc finger, C3HC4 type (RING finger) containing protein n=1 Tax=Novymonas esmeraldas TaxID=1808958 RepID=A0AAW0EM63_9TRYP
MPSKLLHEALVHTECPICLQPLGNSIEATPPTQDTSPSSTSHTPHAPPPPLRSVADAAGRTGEFHILVAPNVYGTDDDDPWLPTLAATSAETRPTRTSAAVAAASAGSSGSGSSEAADVVVVLPCGHLLHLLCAMQLCEYAQHPSCPVCRLKLSSSADVVHFSPRSRPQVAQHHRGRAEVAVVGRTTNTPTTADTPKRRRVEAGRGGSGSAPSADVPHTHDDHHHEDEEEEEDSNSVQVVVVPPPPPPSTYTAGDGAEVGAAAEAAEAEDRSGDAVVLGEESSGSESGAPSAARQTEAEITLVGARQLPPSQAYAELLLRTSSSWAVRAETLEARVGHLEASQRQLQSDCSELERTVAVARRRREVLLSVPSSKEDEDATRMAAQRLRELRRLCVDTRTAITSTTALLAQAIRESAEVQRQMEKYTRKLARLDAER